MSFAKRKLHLLALLTVSALALSTLAVACGGGDDEDSNADASPGAATSPGGNGGETVFDISAGDNFFEYKGEKKPTLPVPAGEAITINITNNGTAVHNMRFAGDDNSYDTADDAVSDPGLVYAGQSATLTFSAPSKAGTYDFRCDFHPTDSFGKIKVQ